MIEKKEDLDVGEAFSKVIPDDLVKYGLIPELVGRLPIITNLNQLSKEAFINILTKPKNALLKQYKKLFKMDNVELEIEDDAVEEIVELAFSRKTGARGLRSIMESIMMESMYEVPSNPDIEKCVITKDTVLKKEKAKYILKKVKV